MNEIVKKATAIVMSMLIVFGTISVAFASGDRVKDEVIYTLLNSDGSKREVYVVNSFENAQGEIVDYGSYESVRNLTTDDAIDISGQEIRINTNSENLYYEGSLPESQLPWIIDIQ